MPTTEIEILREGTFVAMGGKAFSFTKADLASIATGYSREIFDAPVVIGHPEVDAPAYAWVKSVAVKDNKLVAEVCDVEPQFAQIVNEGRYRKISPSFFTPAAPNNPKPGAYYLRHVGFLGAAAPAVNGLKPVSFAADADGIATVEFSSSYAINLIVFLFRNLRDQLIAEKGIEAADKVLPPYEIAALARALEEVGPLFSQPQEPVMPTTENDRQKLDQELKDLEAGKKKLAEEQAAFAAKETERNKADATRFIEDQVNAGRLPKGLQAQAAEFMASLDSAGVIEFSEGNGKVKRSQVDQFRTLVSALPLPVSPGQVVRPGDPESENAASFAAPPGRVASQSSVDLNQKALAYQQKHTGISYADAVRAVQ